MGSPADAVKRLKGWQIGVLAAVLLGAAGVTYGIYALVSDSGSGGLGEDQEVIPVQFGDLVNQVSTNGSLIFPNKETLTFGTQGTVGAVLVEEGQRVEEGQPLASLDEAGVASLERVVAQARVNLQRAEDVLTTVMNPNTPVDLAKAAVAVTNSMVSVESAQELLDAIKARPTEEDIAKAQSQVDSTEAALASALGDLSLGQKEWNGRVRAAQEVSDIALEGYRGVINKWLGIEISETEAGMEPDTLLGAWGVDLASLFRIFDFLPRDIDKGWLAGGLPTDDPATAWSEVTIYAWLNLYPGQLVGTCDDGVVPSQGACVKKEMDDAWNDYQQAKDNLDTVQIQADKAIANDKNVVTRAEDSFAAAEEGLADVKAGPDALEIESKENQLVLAHATLEEAEEKLVELQGGVDSLEVALREAEVTSALASLEQASQRLEGSILKAPMAGIVSLVNVEAGQTINVNTPIVEIVDPSVVEVDGIVDEIDVLFVREGARTDISMDALPGQVLEGTVSTIASVARNQQGVVSYPIRIRVQLSEGLELREGLSATASIVIREELDVLLVPLQSLYGTFKQPVVRVLNNGRIEERPVVLGNNDDFWVAVREGLAEGDQVIMEAQAATTGQFSFFGGRGQFQGGLQGGGLQRGGGGGQQTPQPRR